LRLLLINIRFLVLVMKTSNSAWRQPNLIYNKSSTFRFLLKKPNSFVSSMNPNTLQIYWTNRKLKLPSSTWKYIATHEEKIQLKRILNLNWKILQEICIFIPSLFRDMRILPTQRPWIVFFNMDKSWLFTIYRNLKK